MPGPVSATETRTSPLTRATLTPTIAALGRELHGIREKVEDDLPHPPFVARDDVDVRDGREVHTHHAVRRPFAHHDDAALERFLQGERRDVQLELARLDLGEVEDVVDQRQQVVSGREDVLDVLLLLLVEVAEHPLAQYLREPEDRVERGAELVGHVREELRLVLARRLERLVQAPELVVHPVHVGRERAQLVAVGDVDMAREVA